MDDRNFELIKAGTVEILTPGELKKAMEKKKPVTYCGYEVSGEAHMGHMITASKLLELQKAGFTVKVLLADWHTFLNRKGDWEWIQDMAKMWRKVFTGFGLDRTSFVLGSDFQREDNYFNDLMQMTQKTTISRALRSMQEVARDIENAHVSQAIYPFMQVEDIKALGVDVAVSGIDQRKIHMLARELLPEMEYKPPVCVHTPIISSLKGPETKMSSSIPDSLISARDSDSEIKRKMTGAYCPPGVIDETNPVFSIVRFIVFPRVGKFKVERDSKFGGDIEFSTIKDLEDTYKAGKLHPMDMKNAAIKYLADILKPVRKQFPNK